MRNPRIGARCRPATLYLLVSLSFSLLFSFENYAYVDGKAVVPVPLVNVVFNANIAPYSTTSTGSGQYSALAAQLAVADINNKSYASFMFSSSIANITTTTTMSALLPKTNISLTMCDTSGGGVTNVGPLLYSCLSSSSGSAIVGPTNSDQTAEASYVSKYFKVPLVSFGAISTQFADKTTYPTVYRVAADVNGMVRAMFATVLNLGWTRVAILYPNSQVGQDSNTIFSGLCASHNMTVVVSQIYVAATGNQGTTFLDYSAAVAPLVAFDVRIILIMTQSFAELSSIMNSATQANINDAKHAYITMSTPLGLVIGNFLPLFQFVIALSTAIDYTAAGVTRFADVWNKHSTTTYLGSIPPSNVTAFMQLPRTITDAALLTYDAMFVVAYALRKSIYDYGLDFTLSTTKAGFLKNISAVRFSGLTGDIFFDATGSRSFTYTAWQFVGSQWNPVAFVNPNFTWTISSSSSASSSSSSSASASASASASSSSSGSLVPFQWLVSLPLDHNVRPIVFTDSSLIVAVDSVVSLSVVLLFVCACITLHYRKNPLFKAASPVYLLLFLLGLLLLLCSLYCRVRTSSMSLTQDENTRAHLGITTCAMDVVMLNVGYAMTTGALIVKTARVAIIFNQKRFLLLKLSDSLLALWLTSIVALQSIILFALLYTYPVQYSLIQADAVSDMYSCSPSSLISIWLPVLLCFRFLLLALSCIYAFLSRSIDVRFNESGQIATTCYNLLVATIALSTIESSMVTGKREEEIATTVILVVMVLSTVAIMYVPKMVMLVQGADAKTTTNFTATSNQYMTNNRTQVVKPNTRAGVSPAPNRSHAQ